MGLVGCFFTLVSRLDRGSFPRRRGALLCLSSSFVKMQFCTTNYFVLICSLPAELPSGGFLLARRRGVCTTCSAAVVCCTHPCVSACVHGTQLTGSGDFYIYIYIYAHIYIYIHVQNICALFSQVRDEPRDGSWKLHLGVIPNEQKRRVSTCLTCPLLMLFPRGAELHGPCSALLPLLGSGCRVPRRVV